MKKSLLILAILFAAAFMLQACDLFNSEEEGSGISSSTIHGIVTDKATGEPIRSAGVELTPTGKKTVTGNEGQFEFTELTSGYYTLFITKTGYEDLESSEIFVADGEISKTDIQITPLPPALRTVDDNANDISELDFGAKEDDLVRSFLLFNDGSETLTYEIVKTASWLTLNRETGTLTPNNTHVIVVTIDRNALKKGDNETTIHITSDHGARQIRISAVGNPKYIILEENNLMVMTEDLGKTDDFDTAQEMCDNITAAGFSDWRLPTIGELSILYTKQDEIGGFKSWDDYYWSSTYEEKYFDYGERYYNAYSIIKWGSGEVYTTPYRKVNTLYVIAAYVRAVRTITP